MKISELVNEGWGAEKQARDLEASNARWRPVVAKYADDPEMSQYVKYFRIYGGNSPEEAEEKALHAAKHNKKLPDWFTNPKPVHGYKLGETATAGSTSAGNVAVGAVYKNKPAKQAKNKDGTAKNALDIKANLLTGGSIKR